MSEKIVGIEVQIGGDTAGLESAISKTNKEINATQRELTQVEKLLKFDPKNTELLAQKQELLSKQIGQTQTKVEALKNAKANADKQMKDGTSINEEQYRKLQREIASSEISMNKLEKASKGSGKEVKNLGNNSKDASSKLQTLKGVASGVASGIAAIATAGVGATTAIVGMAIKAGASADDLNTLSAQTGLSTEQIQKFQYASDLIDVSLDTLTGSMAKLTKNMATASKGTGDAYNAFNQLGVSVKNADGTLRNNEDVFNDCITALGKIENETQRDAYAMQIFGKSAQDLNPLIKGGAEQLKVMGDQAKKLGFVLDQDTLDKANAFNDEIDILKANASGAFSALGSEIASELTPYMSELNEVATSALSDIVTSFHEGGLEGLVITFSQILSDIINKIIEYLPKIMDMGIKIIQTLLSGLQSNLSTITSSAVQIIMMLVNGLIGMLPQILQMGITILIELINGMAQQMPTLIPTIVECVMLIIQTLVDNLGLLIEAGINLLIAIITGIVQAIPQLIQMLPQIVTTIVTVLTDNLPLIIEAGITILVMLITGIMDTIPELVKALPQIITAIVNGIKNGLNKIIELGKNLVEGLWQGIINAKNWLYNKVMEFARGIIDSIKRALGIASPSKVMRDQVGKNMALGIGEGFSSSMKNVAKEMTGVMDKITQSMNTEITFADIPNVTRKVIQENSYITKTYNNSTETIRQSSPIILSLDGKELGRVIVPLYDKEKNRLGVSIS